MIALRELIDLVFELFLPLQFLFLYSLYNRLSFTLHLLDQTVRLCELSFQLSNFLAVILSILRLQFLDCLFVTLLLLQECLSNILEFLIKSLESLVGLPKQLSLFLKTLF